MEKVFYTVSEIIFGLRKEYLDNQKKLDELKKYLIPFDKNIESIDLWIATPLGRKNAELMCSITKRQRQIEKLCNVMLKKVGESTYPKNYSGFVRNNNDEYFLRNNDIKVKVLDDCMEEFSDGVKEILDSDFAKNIAVPYQIGCYNEPNPVLEIRENGIRCYVVSNMSQGFSINYEPKSDTISMNSRGNIDPRKLYYLFNEKILEGALPEYHKRVINFRNKSNMQFDLNNSDSSKTVFKIKEEGNQYVLK